MAAQQGQNASIAQQQLNSQQAQTTAGIQGQQQNFANAVLAPTIGQQAGLTAQLQANVAGQGPNVALNQLNQTTGQNVANQAALMAGQRGAGANAGLLARQAAQQGAATQQNAVGQAATLGAQQQVAYTGMLQQQLANQQSLGLGAQNASAQTALANQGMTNSALQQQAALNSGLTNTNASLIGQGTSLAQTGIQASQQGATNVANIQGGLMGQANGATNKAVGQDVKGIGQAAMAMMASGGRVMKADGGPTLGTSMDAVSGPSLGANMDVTPKAGTVAGMESGVSKAQAGGNPLQAGLKAQGEDADVPSDAGMGFGNSVSDMIARMASGGKVMSGPKSNAGKMMMRMAQGGKVPALVSPGEKYLPPKAVEEVAKGKKEAIKAGHTIPGKPKVGGAKNSYANDTVKKTLDSGGIILPRSVTKAKDPKAAAHKFVQAILAKQGLRK